VFEDEEKFIIAALIDQRKPGYMAMKEVKDQIEPLVRREKKAEIIIDRIEEKTGDFNAMAMALGAEIRHYDNLRFNGQNLKGFGREVEVIAKIFNLEEGSTSSPIQGNMAVYVVKMNTISEPRAITNYQGTKSSMEQRFQRNAARIYQSIKESADVEDNTLVAF